MAEDGSKFSSVQKVADKMLEDCGANSSSQGSVAVFLGCDVVSFLDLVVATSVVG
jgi:hypothetical protein